MLHKCGHTNLGIVAGTRIKRYMGYDKSKISGPISGKVLLNLVEKSVSDSVHTPLFLLLDRSVTGVTGKMFSNLNEMAILDVGLDDISGKKLAMIDDYWTDLKSKEQIETMESKSTLLSFA